MRILHVATRHRVGGAERNLRYTVAAEVARGFEVDIAVGGDGLVRDFSPEAGIHCIPELVRNPSPTADARALGRLRELIGENEYDVVHTHQSKAGALGRWAARGRAKVIVHTVHMASFGPGYGTSQSVIFRRAERILGRCTDRSVFVGDDVMRRYVAAGAADPSRCVVIPSPIPNLGDLLALRTPSVSEAQERRRMIGVGADCPVILSVAALDRRKRHMMMIDELAPVLAAGEAVLVIVGEGPEQARLEARCAELGLREAVQFRGFVDDVTTYFAAADLFVHTSTLEGVSQAVVQAVAAGVPILATEVDGLHEAASGEPHVSVLSRDGAGLGDAVRAKLRQPRPALPAIDQLEKWLPPRVDAELSKFQDWLEERVHQSRSEVDGHRRYRLRSQPADAHRRESAVVSPSRRLQLGRPPRRGQHPAGFRKRESAAAPRARESLYVRAIAATDVCAAVTSVYLASNLIGHHPLRWPVLLAAPVIALLAEFAGLYDRDRISFRSTLDEVPRLVQITSAYTLIVWLLDGILAGGHLSHGQAVVLWLSCLLLLAGGRAGARANMRCLAWTHGCLFIGDRDTWERFRARCIARGGTAQVVHFPLRTRAGGRYEPLSAQLVAAESRLRKCVAAESVSHVVVAVDEHRADDTVDGVVLLRRLGLKVSVIPNLPEGLTSASSLADFDGMSLVCVRSFGPSRFSLLMKRALDICGAAVVLLLLAPLFAVIAVAVKLGSPGSVFYHQRRVGRDGRVFLMHKFRTMVNGAHAQRAELVDVNETAGLFKLLEDRRVTPVGRFLRRSSLDELPQLWNVVRGEMSLVGPRPLVPEEDSRVIGWGRCRLDVSPGMTGDWQVMRGLRVPLEEMIMIDYLYVSNWSLWSDVKALLRTVPHMVGRRGL